MIARNNHHRALRVSTLTVALLAAFGLIVGCSTTQGEAKNDAPLPEAAGLIAASSAATKALHDVYFDLSVEGSVPNLPVKSVSAYLTNVPTVAAQGDADVVYNGTPIAAKFVVVNGDLWAQLAAGQPYSNSGPAANVYDASAILDPERGIAKVISSVRDPKVEGREQIGGVETIRIAGVIPGTALTGIAPKTTLGDRPLTFWVQEAAPNNLVRANVGFDAGTLSVTLSEWGKKQKLIDPKTGK